MDFLDIHQRDSVLAQQLLGESEAALRTIVKRVHQVMVYRPMFIRGPWPLLLAALLFLGLSACWGSSTTTTPTPPIAIRGPTAEPTAPSTLTEPATRVDLPRDEGAHDTSLEWRYFNGHLTDDAGKPIQLPFRRVSDQGHRWCHAPSPPVELGGPRQRTAPDRRKTRAPYRGAHPRPVRHPGFRLADAGRRQHLRSDIRCRAICCEPSGRLGQAPPPCTRVPAWSAWAGQGTLSTTPVPGCKSPAPLR